MAKLTTLSDIVVNAQADALSALCAGGTIKIYDGAMPASPETAITTQTLGVTLTLSSPAFGAAVNGVLTATAITGGTAVADLTPTWARILKSDGVTAVMDVTVGSADANIILTPFFNGMTITASAFTHDVRNSTAGY